MVSDYYRNLDLYKLIYLLVRTRELLLKTIVIFDSVVDKLLRKVIIRIIKSGLIYFIRMVHSKLLKYIILV